VHELFDLIAGTSTGGILACALTRPSPETAAGLVDLYLDEGPRIFHRGLLKRLTSVEGWIDERYDDDGLMGALRDHLGDTRLKQALTPVLVTAYDLEGRFAFFFRSDRAVADDAYDFAMWEVARATSAAPTYFEPARITDAAGRHTYSLVDGGVFAVNPAMCAYADVARRGTVDLVASLGTGSKSEQQPIPYEKARRWGQLAWARPILDVVFDGVADTVDFQVATLLAPGAYVRLQTRLRNASGALDDASPEHLHDLQDEARRLISERSADIDALCARLT
jgi:predicted acylesterase/phospholipase RssA